MTEKLTYSAKFKRNYVAVFATALCFLMVASEIVLAVSIPAYVEWENVLADEAMRQNVLLKFDNVRKLCDSIPEKDEVLTMEKQTMQSALDPLAMYLRDNANSLSSEELRELDNLLTEAERIVIRMRRGRSYSKANRLDSAAYINGLVKKHAVKGLK